MYSYQCSVLYLIFLILFEKEGGAKCEGTKAAGRHREIYKLTEVIINNKAAVVCPGCALAVAATNNKMPKKQNA